jgi:alkylhydroperoxidase family enzyme
MSTDDIELARTGSSTDPRRAAVARFVQRVIETRGQVGDADIAGVRTAGYSDAEILAIVTIAVVFLLTNYLNNVNQTVVDVPAVDGQAV